MTAPRCFRNVLPLAALLLLGACSGDELSRNFGLTRDAPDEFQVTTRAPLSMPPDYSLRPPRPGAARPQELTQRQQAEAALSPDSLLGGANRSSSSSGEQALVAQAGPSAPRDIRDRVNADSQLDNPPRSFTDRLMFWKPAPLPGTTLDPQGESQRIRQNAALGQPVVTGDTPIIQPKRSGFFSSLF